MTMRARLIDAAFWLGWNGLWLLPAPVSRLLFDGVGRLAWRTRSRGVRQLEVNLGQALGLSDGDPRTRATSRAAVRSYMRYYCETFLLPRWSAQEIDARVRAVGEHHVAESLATGGAIVTLPHSGNWDLAGAWAAQRFGTVATIAERLRPEGVFNKFMAVRRARGIALMPLTGEPGIYEFLRDHVRQGHLVALLGDRDVARNGMSVLFCGRKAPLPIGAALLALDTGRPLLTCGVHFDGPTLVITFDPPIPMEGEVPTGRERLRRAQEVTAVVAERLERHIREHPENWHQLQPVWPDMVTA